MIPTKRAHRVAAVLAVPALLLTACGSEDSGAADDSSAPSGPVATVSGDLGAPPEITVDEDAEIGEETVVEVVSEGDGAEVRDGDFVRVDVVGQVTTNQMELLNTWANTEQTQGGGQADEGGEAPRQQFVVQVGAESMIPAPATAPLAGTTVGSRVQVEGSVTEMLGAGAVNAGFGEQDGVVWVFDIGGTVTVDAASHVEGEHAATADGMPEVTDQGDEAPAVTIPEGQDPPAELQEQVLIEGDGPEVTDGQGVIAQYVGLTWADGETFDSSWERGAASGFQIGTQSVVAGWDQGLAGKNVGDRVLLVIPPDLGYGDNESGNGAIPPGSTLVFVVDVIGVV
ncbi:FKBP-type peptidyl-prolyl cis-trans isomerase [Streptomyces marincola]|uniref:FKBP-type peptidyl-prolyl cis-trans isomerase n=1 Tax=Streptomyces marincola TaxID=2878388 RepID=UPI001CF1DC29|nr:FKBP-type peptidyl-prolyl cis-trans isomerase [Streptomyces marincola]UCM86902.1 FKBP-type peptidyl-prolyl cis-trans isomerase [Streptomyces marincola]